MKDKKDIIRFQNVIEKDRIKNSESYKELIVCDIIKILKDYFEYNEEPELEIVKEKGKYLVKLILTATNLRPIGFLPKK